MSTEREKARAALRSEANSDGSIDTGKYLHWLEERVLDLRERIASGEDSEDRLP